jgi:ribosomal protein L37AE/L43A
MTDKLIAALRGLLTLDELEFGDESVLEAEQPNHPFVVAVRTLREAERFTGAVTAITKHHVVCPACQKPSGTLDHLKQNTETLWYCDECGVRYKLVLKDGRVEVTATADRTEKRLVVLKREGFYLIVEGLVFIGADAPDAGEHNHAYFYNEHTCPTNYLKRVKAVVEKSEGRIMCLDPDPHGCFEYVATLPWDNDIEDSNSPLPVKLVAQADKRVRQQSALNEFYNRHGIGPRELAETKFRFWETQQDGYSISHSESMTVQQKVAVFETAWLATTFSQDYPQV